jgi:hypothetical protein
MGITVGYVGSNGKLNNAADSTERCSDEDGANSPSIESEFKSGLDAMTQWFPESAQVIRDHSNEIISHMVAITDPETGSDLWGMELTPQEPFDWDTGVFDFEPEDEELDLNFWTMEDKEERRLARTNSRKSKSANATLPSKPTSASTAASKPTLVPTTTSTVTSTTTSVTTTTTTTKDTCAEAVAELIHATTDFVAGFARITIPRKYAFRIALISRINRMPKSQFNDLARDSIAWMQEHRAEDKVKALHAFMRKSWNNVLKFMFQWLAKMTKKKPWDVVKEIVRLASQFVVWFHSKSPAALLGSVGLQLDVGHDVLEAGKYASQQCNKTMSDFTPRSGFLGKLRAMFPSQRSPEGK